MEPNALQAILDRRAAISLQRQKLDEEDRELEIAEKVVRRLFGPKGPNLLSAELPVMPRTQADYVSAILGSGVLWMESDALRQAIVDIYGIDIKPSSFQPLLSKMKSQGVIAKEGGRFALVSRLDVEEPGRIRNLGEEISHKTEEAPDEGASKPKVDDVTSIESLLR